jgi:transcriptional regulator with PAS, ATPase and Fis domain
MLAWANRADDETRTNQQQANYFSVLQEISSLLMHAGRPELVATGLIAVLQHSAAITAARAVARGADHTEDVLGTWGVITDAAAVRTFAIGTSRDRTIELQIQPLPDVESQATVNAVAFLIAAGQDIERARIEREERLTLWPVDELPAEDDDSVVAGKMRDVMLSARKVAQSSVTVLLTGESGTGKEVVARAIHRYSARAKKPFVPFNCTAVPRELMESHLFGYKRGAFTGADRDNPGLIRAAKDGTLFLDEIGEMSLDLQPKLLRFLESGEINPLGETTPFSVNVRIVAATNANLRKLIEEGKFREDLYYRLNVIPIELPPLRDRREEIQPLAQHFALKWSHELGKGCIRVAPDLIAHLVLYPWPGNIRQLSNEIHRMVALAEPNAPLTLDHFPRAMREETETLKRRASGLEMTVPLSGGLDHAISKLEREMITRALRESNGRVDAAAKALGISRKGLYLKRQRLGL